MGDRLGATLDIRPFVPSLAYRMCMAASGALDFAVAGANSHDWDVAAADLLVEEAGGRLMEAAGERLQYNRARIRRGALLAAPAGLAPRLLDAFAPRPAGDKRNKPLATFARLAFRPERGQTRATQPSRQDSRGHPP